MSDTPTAALAAALHEIQLGCWQPQAYCEAVSDTPATNLHAGQAAALVEALPGWELVPSGSLLDMARAVVALATETETLVMLYQGGRLPEGSIQALSSPLHVYAATIAAARERVQAAGPGT